MSSLQEIKAKVKMIGDAALSDGMDYPRMNRMGVLYTDVRERLVDLGFVYRGSVGTVTGDAAVTGATGAGETDIDLDEPDMIITCPAGFYMIPLEVMVCALVPDLDADLETIDTLVTMDVSAALTAAELATGGTAGTLYNLLDGAGNLTGRYAYTVTTAVTNPTNEHILYANSKTLHLATSGAAVSDNTVLWQPRVLGKYAGPCQMVVYQGATAAHTLLASAVVAFVPSGYYPIV